MQDLLEKSAGYVLTDQQYDDTLAYARKVGRDDGFDKIFMQHDVDVVIGLAESALTYFVSAAGVSRKLTPEEWTLTDDL